MIWRCFVVVSIALFLFAVTASCAPFTKGNILAVKAEIHKDEACTTGYLTELTPAGEIVQEIALPTEGVNGTHPCLIHNDDYFSHLTVSNDGYRAIVPCCNYINGTETTEGYHLTSFAVIYGNGVIQVTEPFDADNRTVGAVYNAVLDNEHVWFSTSGRVYYTTLGSSTSQLVFEGDVFSLRCYDGNLYVSNYDGLESAIMQIGEGLPTTMSNATIFLNETYFTNGFEFSENYLTIGNYPKGLFVYKKTSHELVYANEGVGEIVQLVVLEDQGKILAQVDDSPTVIQEFTFDENGISNGSIWLNATETHYYYGLIMTPEDSCQDKIKNFDESDVDCGGSICSARCIDGKSCSSGSDCSSHICVNNVCGLPAPIGTPEVASDSSPKSNTSTATKKVVYHIALLVLIFCIWN